MRSLIKGKFSTAPAVRLMGTVKVLQKLGLKRLLPGKVALRSLVLTKGYNMMWSRMHSVRDVEFDSFEPMSTGKMTSGLL